MSWIPKARSGKWWIISAVSTLIFGAGIGLVRFGLMDQAVTAVHAFRFLLLAAVLSFVFGLAGWLGAKWLWGLSSIGVLLGLVLMATMADDRSGWEDLVGFLSFLMITALGIAAGLLVEAIAAIVRNVRKSG
ncbi:hypothetical protein ACFQZE_16555 [Paenibacillus sp. GCM10027627]|uniref:hypothetical protein n=1 Tax=unclassified Paenibacillus TaxID=185978 RepID=UPI00363422EA